MWRVVSFPDMRVTVDGEETEVITDHLTGLVVHTIGLGRHTVVWKWQSFYALRASHWVSIVVVLLLFSVLAIGLNRRQATLED